jgi:hypothetical protein
MFWPWGEELGEEDVGSARIPALLDLDREPLTTTASCIRLVNISPRMPAPAERRVPSERPTHRGSHVAVGSPSSTSFRHSTLLGPDTIEPHALPQPCPAKAQRHAAGRPRRGTSPAVHSAPGSIPALAAAAAGPPSGVRACHCRASCFTAVHRCWKVSELGVSCVVEEPRCDAVPGEHAPPCPLSAPSPPVLDGLRR